MLLRARVLVKLCGLTTPSTIRTAIALQATIIGLVSFPPSPRHVDRPEIVRLLHLVHHARGPRPYVALLSVNQAGDPRFIRFVQQAKPDIVQCHGNETLEELCHLRRQTGVMLLKSLSLSDDMNIAEARKTIDRLYRRGIGVLIDAPSGPELPGGTGTQPDLRTLNRLRGSLSRGVWILAGGLHPTDVTDKMAQLRPWGVDVSSSIERIPGVKDPMRMRAFVRSVRGNRQSRRRMSSPRIVMSDSPRRKGILAPAEIRSQKLRSPQHCKPSRSR